MSESWPAPPSQFQFKDWNLVHAEFDWIYEGAVAPQYRESTIQHPGQSVFLVREGSVLIQTEKGSMRAGAGQWILPRQGNRLEKFYNDARIVSIHFQLHWPGGQPLFAWDCAAKFHSAAHPKLERLSMRLLRHVLRRFPEAREGLPESEASLSDHFLLRHYFAAWLHLFLETLLSEGYSPTRMAQIDPRLLLTVQTLDRLPLTSVFKEEPLARQVKLSISQLDRLFVGHFGTTPRRYFEQRKLQEAKARVRYAESMKLVAFELGFSSLQHFSGWFKNNTGYSPTQFQNHVSKPVAKP